jgi:hypothetical protein
VSESIGRITFEIPPGFQVDALTELTETPCGSSGDGALMLVLATSRDPVAIGPLGTESVLDLDPREGRQQIVLQTLPLSAPLHFLRVHSSALSVVPGYEERALLAQKVRGQVGGRSFVVHGTMVPIGMHTYAWIQGDELISVMAQGPAALADEVLDRVKQFITTLGVP